MDLALKPKDNGHKQWKRAEYLTTQSQVKAARHGFVNQLQRTVGRALLLRLRTDMKSDGLVTML